MIMEGGAERDVLNLLDGTLEIIEDNEVSERDREGKRETENVHYEIV
jgi:hypothetical protein